MMSVVADNFFKMFGLDLSYSIDRQQLDQAYRQLQQVSHPDRFVNQPSEFQRQAVQQTALNSEAYQVLKSPILRACHLLALAGSSFDLSSYRVSDTKLLMQQMQYRENLSEIKQQADLNQLDEFSEFVQQLSSKTEAEILKLFDQGSNENSTALKNHICELQFLNKLAIDIDEVEEDLMLIQ